MNALRRDTIPCSHDMLARAQWEEPSSSDMKTEIDRPTKSEDSRPDQREAKLDPHASWQDYVPYRSSSPTTRPSPQPVTQPATRPATETNTQPATQPVKSSPPPSQSLTPPPSRPNRPTTHATKSATQST